MKRSADLSSELLIKGFRVEHYDKEPHIEGGIPILATETKVILRLFGSGLKTQTKIGLTQDDDQHQDAICNQMRTLGSEVYSIDESGTTALVEIELPKHSYTMYICASVKKGDNEVFIHQGKHDWLKIKSHEPALPFWMQISIIMICLCFSALFSGLNLGLMSLDRTDLKVNNDSFLSCKICFYKNVQS